MSRFPRGGRLGLELFGRGWDGCLVGALVMTMEGQIDRRVGNPVYFSTTRPARAAV